MSLSAISCASQELLIEEAGERIKSYISSGKKVLLICPSGEWVRERKKSLASEIPFGVDVLTFSRFIQQRWGLEGDGRALINNSARQVLISKLISEWNSMSDRVIGSTLVGSFDFANHIAQFIKNGSGSQAFEGFPLVPEGLNLSLRERAIIDLAVIYQGELLKRSLIEENEALSNIDCADARDIVLVIEGFFTLSKQQLDFIKRVSVKRETLVVGQYRENDIRFAASRGLFESILSVPGATRELLDMVDAPVSELDRFKEALFTLETIPAASGDVLFAEAQGIHAENTLIAKVVEGEVLAGTDPGTIVVWMKDTSACASGLVDELDLRGIPAVVARNLQVGITPIGVAIISLFELITQKSHTAASAFVTSPFSGVTQRKGWEYNRKWRESRETDVQILLDDIVANEPVGSAVVAIIHLAEKVITAGIEWRSPLNELLDAMCHAGESQKNMLPTLDIKQAWAVNDALCHMAEQGEPAGASFDLEMFMHSTVRSDITTSYVSDIEGSVRIVSPLSATPKKYDVVIITNLNSSEYPMDQDGSPLDALLENLGVVQPVDLADVQRWNFYQAIQHASNKVIFERSLFDLEAKETIASALYEAALGVYTTTSESEMNLDIIKETEGDLAHTIPAQRGLKRDLRRQVSTPGAPRYISAVKRGELQAVDGLLDGCTSFSPTEIEAYIECPYQWFYDKRVGPKSIDKEFGVKEQGVFLHGILALFYQKLTTDDNGNCISRRIDANNLDTAMLLLDTCIEEYRCVQGELVVTNEIERTEVEGKIRTLRNFIKSEVDFLPSYYPKEFEYAFGYGDRTVQYAGVSLKGCIDRIDVHADAKKLVVVDYKSGSVVSYQLPKSGTRNKEKSIYNTKVQAPIYASAISRLFEMPAVGSVYRSISTRETAGSWSVSDLGLEDSERFPTNGAVPRDTGSCNPLQDEPENYKAYLDGVEEFVAAKLERLKEGIIIPDPCCKDACKYCGARSFCGEAL